MWFSENTGFGNALLLLTHYSCFQSRTFFFVSLSSKKWFHSLFHHKFRLLCNSHAVELQIKSIYSLSYFVAHIISPMSASIYLFIFFLIFFFFTIFNYTIGSSNQPSYFGLSVPYPYIRKHCFYSSKSSVLRVMDDMWLISIWSSTFTAA